MGKTKKTPRPQIELFAAEVEKKADEPFESPSKTYGNVDDFLGNRFSGFSIGSPKNWKHLKPPSKELIDAYISKF